MTANFQVIFSGNEDELYRFIITWKMLSDLKRYEEMKREVEQLEEKIRELREELKKLDETRKSMQREISELIAKREVLKKERIDQLPADTKIL
ncbi:MAG: hypothetical protein QW655_01805 [Nitrososphaerota archaeon]|nr:V-type ATPase subunit a family protein [Candidatus Geocrenenecus dongiae]